ncbi:hypothetical protein B0H14DRAFT_2765127 [Mycena olivaceomarginata]|nr:hypothetical protein B0H14DRAFT_2765127 [Mycena olivaceomarginata]
MPYRLAPILPIHTRAHICTFPQLRRRPNRLLVLLLSILLAIISLLSGFGSATAAAPTAHMRDSAGTCKGAAVRAVRPCSCPLLHGLFYLTSRRVDGQRRELTVGTLCVGVRVLRVLRVRISVFLFFLLPSCSSGSPSPPTRAPEQIDRTPHYDEVLE